MSAQMLNISQMAFQTFVSKPVVTDRGDQEKVLAMIILGLGSFIAGMLPAAISERNRRRFPLTTSLLLCFGAGVLLATAMVHILPEVREQMKSNFAEIAICAGFFIIYFIDEFIHFFFGEAIQHTHQHHNEQTATESVTAISNYGTISETAPLMGQPHIYSHDHHSHSGLQDLNNIASHPTASNCNEEAIADANARICHTSHIEPCAQSMTGTLGLFVALSLHSTIEGMAIGVQSSVSKVIFLLGAVACHKFVMGFCLGLEFLSNPQTKLRTQFIGILVFALGTVCGIVIGMLIVDMPAVWSSPTLPVIQALAGGTLFYVTVCEVIPREKARWHQNATRRAAGFAQFFAVGSGFAALCIINFYFKGILPVFKY